MKILVRNLSRQTVKADLVDLFKAYGKLHSSNIVMDEKTGKSKGFGFIEMPNGKQAKAAIKELDGQIVDGSKIRVKKAVEPAAQAE